MSGSLPFEKQFSSAEQEEMFVACVHDDENQQAGNLLELIHYLASQGVPVTEILGKVRCSTTPSHDGVMPRSLTVRIKKHGLAPFEDAGAELVESVQGSAQLVFVAPKFGEVAA